MKGKTIRQAERWISSLSSRGHDELPECGDKWMTAGGPGHPPLRSSCTGIHGLSAALLVLSFACGEVAEAALEVDFITNRGTITAIMEYQKAPKAVANVIGLATANRSYVDPVSGAVLRSRFFDGAEFFKVVNSPSVKTIETGSPTGEKGVGPGYTFPDEFDDSLTHVPYVLSMSNCGPNTNGSSICFTGNVALLSRDGVNTVFGRVTSSASRAVVDLILTGGAGASQVQSVVVRRTDEAAMAFNANAVGLPEVRAVDSPLLVLPAVSVSWAGSQPACSVLQAHDSQDLVHWTPHFSNMVGLDDAIPTAPLWVDDAAVPSRFYQFSLVGYADAKGSSSMAGRTLTVESPGVGTIIYQFNAEGTGGSYANILLPGEKPFFSGPFVVVDSMPPVFDPYAFRILLYADGLGGSPYNLIRGGYDVVSDETLRGRQITLFSDDSQSPVFEDVGTFELTRP